ncbi:contractile injection system protein, VgrG/Pvc8 family [Flocculibacter collagenilyticus]|uniref:contractile injection system protein, VgrG/Pvc8 family n=1 Tax=Flocculibacter collagenilyticus TaxID=2744479 RepID=UPI0018F4A670|nr:contractile injection system protein, VgrG/Pvc8 family [Flocculibacter collagenilyticus]
MTKDLSRTRIALHCLDSRLSVMHVTGEEQLNGAFRYCVWIEVPQTVDCFSILGQSVVLEFIAPDGHSRMLAGTVCEVEARGRFMLSNSSTHHVPVPYRRFAITLTSRLEALQGTEHSRVFVDTDVATLLTCLASEAGYHPSQIDWRLSQSLPGCPQFVQAMESNYQLFQRIVAQYGLLYWFETQHQQEILVISDGNLRSPYLSRTAIAVYSSYGFDRAGLQLDKSSEHHGDANTNTGTNTSSQTQGRARLPFVGFNSIEERCRYTANRVTTTTLSHPPLRHGSHPNNDTAAARANAARAGQGKHLAHYEPVAETVSAAASFATHQSLAQQALATTLTLTGNVPDIFAGCSFTLDDRSRLNASGDYLCIKVSHTSQQPADESRQDGLSKHSCTVTCIPRSTPYKSTMPRPTDKPMLFSARVESPSQYAQLTAQGDYITRLAFDDTARAVGQGGRPLKKLAMYACANQPHATGWHFPLVNDSQVLVGCMNNDPNQSYIVGFCMNEAQPSVVTSATPHHNRLTSSAGHQLLFDDSPTAPQILLHTLGVTPEQSAQHIVLNGSTQPMLEWVSRFGSVNLYAGTDLCLHAEEADVRYVVHGNQCIDVTGKVSQTTAKDSMHYQAATTLDTHTGSQTHTANADISWLSGRSVNAHANSDIAINTPNGAINLSVPQGSTVLQVDGNITIKGTGQGDIRLHNQGGEIKLDSQGNVSLIGTDMLTLNSQSIVFDGTVDYQISGPEMASAPSTVSPPNLPAITSFDIDDDGLAVLADKSITLNYFYSDGMPVEDINYVVTHANQKRYNGTLTNGIATIENVPPGNFAVEYSGASDSDIETLRQELRTNLSAMVEEIRAQAKIQEEVLEQENYLYQGLIYSGAFLTGLYEQGETIVTGIAELVELGVDTVYDIGAAAWRLLGYVARGDVNGLRKEFNQLAKSAEQSFDTLSKAFKTLCMIAQDEESRIILTQFPYDYFDAHSSVEKIKMAGKLALEIILALATYGAGVAISAVAKSRYFAHAGTALAKLAEAIKLKRLNLTSNGNTDNPVKDTKQNINTELETGNKSDTDRDDNNSASLPPHHQKLIAQVEQDAIDIISLGYSKKEMSRLAAISRAQVNGVTITQRAFTNLRGSVNNFKGIEQLDDQSYRIVDFNLYIRRVERLYIDSGQQLHPRTKELISKHVGSSGEKTFETFAGIPGLHAEVQAVNDIFNQVKNANLKDIDVATFKISKVGSNGEPFKACSNCGGILRPPINVITGRKY